MAHPTDDIELVRIDEQGREVRDAQCERHGPFESRLLWRDRWSTCERCSTAERARRDEADRERALNDRRETRLGASGLVGRYRTATFETFHADTKAQADAVAACRAFVDRMQLQPHAWAPLWMIGNPGTGKTLLASAIVRAVIERDIASACIGSARDIVREIRATWRRDASETEADVIASFVSVGLLVIDEIGIAEGEVPHLFDIIDQRYTRNRNVVIVSNLAAPQLRMAVGDRVFDRLREGVHVLVFDWTSHRGREGVGAMKAEGTQ